MAKREDPTAGKVVYELAGLEVASITKPGRCMLGDSHEARCAAMDLQGFEKRGAARKAIRTKHVDNYVD